MNPQQQTTPENDWPLEPGWETILKRGRELRRNRGLTIGCVALVGGLLFSAQLMSSSGTVVTAEQNQANRVTQLQSRDEPNLAGGDEANVETLERLIHGNWIISSAEGVIVDVDAAPQEGRGTGPQISFERESDQLLIVVSDGCSAIVYLASYFEDELGSLSFVPERHPNAAENLLGCESSTVGLWDFFERGQGPLTTSLDGDRLVLRRGDRSITASNRS